VKKLADNSYEVEREIVRELVANGGRANDVRVMPLVTNGVVKGLRFYGVKPTSIAAAIGIKSGDVLTAIDGEEIKTAQQLLDLYSKLDKLNGVELQGTRAGKPLAIQLRFR
jgi:S1-C subfamily serine protease